MLLLRSGITGFYDGKVIHHQRLKKINLKQLCYSMFNLKVRDFIGCEAERNFYEAVI
jgi:hypothetical protein